MWTETAWLAACSRQRQLLALREVLGRCVLVSGVPTSSVGATWLAPGGHFGLTVTQTRRLFAAEDSLFSCTFLAVL